MTTLLKRLTVAGLLFFAIKGLLWLGAGITLLLLSL